MKRENVLAALAVLAKEKPDRAEMKEDDMYLSDLIHFAIEPMDRFFAILLPTVTSESGLMEAISDIARSLYLHAKGEIERYFDFVEKDLGGAIRIQVQYPSDSMYDYRLQGAYISPDRESTPKEKRQPATVATATEKKEDEAAIPDFRTAKPESDEEDQLQRVFEVMNMAGKDWDFLHRAIGIAWHSAFATTPLRGAEYRLLVNLSEKVGSDPEGQELIDKLERLLEAKQAAKEPGGHDSRESA